MWLLILGLEVWYVTYANDLQTYITVVPFHIANCNLESANDIGVEK